MLRVAKLFAGKYKELYTSVPYEKCELQDIINGLNLSMSDSCVTSDHIFKIKDIKHAVSKLKPHKGEGSSALTSDHVVNAGDDLMHSYSHHLLLTVRIFEVLLIVHYSVKYLIILF